MSAAAAAEEDDNESKATDDEARGKYVIRPPSLPPRPSSQTTFTTMMMLPDMTRPANKAATSAEPHFRIRNYGSTPKETFDRRGLSLSDTQTPSSPLRRTDRRTDKWTGVAGPLAAASSKRPRPSHAFRRFRRNCCSVRPSVRPSQYISRSSPLS